MTDVATTPRAIGYVASDLGDQPPDETIRMLTELGYEAVDWTMDQFDPLHAHPRELTDLVGRSNEAGLLTPQLMVHQDYVVPNPVDWENRVRRTELAVEACAAAGVESIGVLTGPSLWEPGHALVGGDLSEADAWALALRALERVLRRAEQAGVVVALEPCWGTLARDRYRTEFVFSRLGCGTLQVNFDPSHFVLSGDDIPATVTGWAGRIAHVHLKDAFGVPGRHGKEFLFLLPGEGAVPWPALLQALDSASYHGPMAIENEAFQLLRGPLHGNIRRSAALARELAAGLLSGSVDLGGPAT